MKWIIDPFGIKAAKKQVEDAMRAVSDSKVAIVRGCPTLAEAKCTRCGMTSPRIVTCDYCGQTAPLTTGEAVYPSRPDLWSKQLYYCRPCGAWVGCHPGTTVPLGRLADAELRRAKMAAHAAFDPLWKGGPMKRPAAYAALAQALGIPQRECHIGMFDVAMCARVPAAVETILASEQEAKQ